MTKIFFVSALSVALIAGTASGQTAAKGDAAKGKEIVGEQCAVCHNTDSDEKKMGPALKGLYKKGKMKNGKAVNDANVKAVIDAGGNGMPAYADMLSADEKEHVIAFLKTI
jgi:mono/diheme cytochrome c family protein